MSLRARVLAGAALIAVVLAVGAGVTTTRTEDHLVEQVDAQLAGAGRLPNLGLGFSRTGPERLSALYVGVERDGGVDTLQPSNLSGDLATPSIDVEDAVTAARTGRPFTVGSSDDDLRYRARAVIERRTGGIVVLALPLADVDNAVQRLVAVEVATTLAVLAVLAVVAWWVVHLGVRPIKRMTETAAAIAGGELSHRVPEATPGTEAAELGNALNQMLGRIEEAFDERSRSEERLRRFVADASHELRTPVTTVRGYAELYRSGGLAAADELDEAMRRTEQEAVRMGVLIEDLLQLARLDEGRPLAVEPVDVAAIVEDAARDARAVAPDRVVTAEAHGPLVVRGDEHRLRQVVANVVGNALVHTDAGTPIEIRAMRRDGVVRLEVVDHGAGMAPEVAARAFERFYRADPSRSRHRGGTGLGLAIVHAAVSAHGGSVSLDSEPGRGTTVRIDLPVDPR